MELKDFIKRTISDIALAINELNKELSDIGLTINPKDKSNSINSFVRLNENDDERAIKEIEFNLSISVSDSTEGGGGLKINVVSAGINRGTSNCTISTVKFSIPVIYPGCYAIKKEMINQ